MEIYSICGYRSHSDGWDDEWRSVDWRSRNLVKALKQKPFNGFSQLSLKKGNLRIDNTPRGQQNALDYCAARITLKLNELAVGNVQLVPIPSSDHVALGANFTGGRLVERVEKFNSELLAAPIAYFNTRMPPSSDGGGRDERQIFNNLRICGLRDLPVVIVDDVYTSGAHFRAMKRFLERQGARCIVGHVVARTVWKRPENMFSIDPEIID